MLLVDLPLDIIVLLYPYLGAHEFLALMSTTSSLLRYRTDAAFWRELTRKTFRIPRQPLLEADGAHWLSLYRSLRDKTCIFTWGNGSAGNLGHYHRSRLVSGSIRGQPRSTGWPQPMENLDAVGVVADVQCGGWSTVLLNDAGQLWAVGSANNRMNQKQIHALEPLNFPSGWLKSSMQCYNPSTAIKEFSMGRDRVLGLADDNKIWQWDNFNHPAQLVFFFGLPNERERRKCPSKKVSRVIAGWSLSSAYMKSIGIIYWSEQGVYDEAAPTDSFITAHKTVPGTSFRWAASCPSSIGPITRIGEVMHYVLLENYIVFTTHESRIYAWKTSEELDEGAKPVELTEFYEIGATIVDLQGTFRRFGVFTTAGKVLIGSQEMLDCIWSGTTEAPQIPPALQNCGVISLAFGDWHFHALHADGTISSYGHEPKACGALGLGSRNVSYLRGVYVEHRPSGDGVLKVPPWGNGRRTVWFEDEKERWLTDTCQKAATSEARDRAMATANDPEAVALMGEWFEREGSNWDAGPQNPLTLTESSEHSPDPFPAYRALKIAAAGWSSAALMLVDRCKAEEIRIKYCLPRTPSGCVPDGSVDESPASTSEETSAVSPTRVAETSIARTIRYVSDWFMGHSNGASRSRPLELTPSLSTPAVHDRAGDYTSTAPSPAVGSSSAVPIERRRRSRAGNTVIEPTYVWDEQPYPRLKFPDGRIMAGQVSVTPWRGGDPDVNIIRES